jgi:hypothetical protein
VSFFGFGKKKGENLSDVTKRLSMWADSHGDSAEIGDMTPLGSNINTKEYDAISKITNQISKDHDGIACTTIETGSKRKVNFVVLYENHGSNMVTVRGIWVIMVSKKRNGSMRLSHIGT